MSSDTDGSLVLFGVVFLVFVLLFVLAQLDKYHADLCTKKTVLESITCYHQRWANTNEFYDLKGQPDGAYVYARYVDYNALEAQDWFLLMSSAAHGVLSLVDNDEEPVPQVVKDSVPPDLLKGYVRGASDVQGVFYQWVRTDTYIRSMTGLKSLRLIDYI